ncbi:MAG: protein-export chaperone SecB [Devosia sp.]|nr:protein-export chaperone SecB [Devosia sp.]
MAEETSAQNAQPSMSLIGQYIRDLSFESPGAPGSIMLSTGNPTFSVGINVGVKKQADEVYAVEITLNAKADRDSGVLFAVELVYGGVFRIRSVPEAQLSQLLMIECPRLIFPFARQVLASVTQQGGFPPLMMEPVDFAQVYMQNLQQLQAAQGAAPGQPN